MVKNILSTFISRVFSSLMTLVVVLISARLLGAEKVGTISLVILAVTILQLVANFVGGGAIVYLAPRNGLKKLIGTSYVWAILTAIAGSLILQLLKAIPVGYFYHVLSLSVILSLATANFMALISRERILAYNVITLLQAFLMLFLLVIFLAVIKYREVMAYVYALYFSYAFAFVTSFILILPSLSAGKEPRTKEILRQAFHYGSITQTGNISQFLNYRLGYYFIEYFLGTAALGIYNVGVQLSESIWLIGRSMSMVQYTRISNENDPLYAARLTLTLVKISFLVSLVCLVMVFALIILFFPLIFSEEFRPIHIVMATLAAGILVFSVSIVLSPYFSGLGNPKHNTISALIGLVFTALLGFLLVPKLGLAGGGIAASCSYLSSTIYQLAVFIRHTHFRFNDFLLKKAEIAGAIAEVKKFFSSGNAGRAADLSRQ